MDLSIIVPLLNEEESLPELVAWIKRVVGAMGISYEILMVDDGSTDASWKVVSGLHQIDPQVKGIRFRRNYGKSAALNTGFAASSGNVVITMDADLQDSPDEIPDLYRMVAQEGFDIVSGWKKKRYDSKLTKNLPSKLYNYTTRKLSGIRLHDMNCGLKAYRSEVVKSIEVFGEMHRYIPVIAKWAGFSKIGEKVVEHRKRQYGVTKFGWERFIYGFLDLMTIMFMSKFGKRPMHLFGMLGTLVFASGFLIAGYLAFDRFIFKAYHMTDRPIFYFGLLAMVLGSMLFLAGFLGELVVRNSGDRNSYLIQEELLES